MPAQSEAQRRYLNATFGHDWTKRHHFDNRGKLPPRVAMSGGGYIGDPVYDDWGHRIEGASPSWYTPTRGEPNYNPEAPGSSPDPQFEPTPIPEPAQGGPPSTQYPDPDYTPSMDIPFVPPSNDWPSSGGSNSPLELINALGYNPSYPYGSSGSGVPTQRAVGGILGTLGTIGGNMLLPGLGGLLLGKLGGIGGRMLTRSLQNGPVPGQPSDDAPPMPSGSVGLPTHGPGGGLDLPQGYSPFGGLPTGFTEGNRDYGNGPNTLTQTGGAPVFYGPGQQYGPQWHGGSITGGPGILAVPGGGNIGNLGGDAVVNAGALGNGGMASGLMAKLAMGRSLEPNNPALTPDPGSVFSNWMTRQYPMSAPASGPVHYANPGAFGGPSSPMQSHHFNPRSSFAGGGMVRPTQKPLTGYGQDTVPAALTPGEVVIPRPGDTNKLRRDQLLAIAMHMKHR